MVKLYGSLTSPYVRKVRVLLREKAVPHQFEVHDPWAPDSPVARYNPLGKVPVIDAGNGEYLFESTLICDYLDTLQGEPLTPASGPERLAVLRWHALAQGLVDAVVARLMEGRRPAPQQNPAVIERQEQKIARALEFADGNERGQAYLVGQRLTMADIALGVALDYVDFRYAHDWRGRHPRLALWAAGIGTRPAFAETLPPGMEKALDAPH